MRHLRNLIIFLVISFLLLLFSLFESFRLFPDDAFPFVSRIIILLLNIIILNILFYFVCVKNTGLKESLKGFFTSIYAIFMIFYFLEFFFIFYPKSHSAGNVALSNISWAQYYNRPINEYNFRGNPIGDLEGKKKIYVIGDSFTAGWGIKDINQRYPEVLEKKLGKEYRVINMGAPGFDTKDEMFVLSEFLGRYDFKKPDLIVWQYFFNDISAPNDSLLEKNIDPYPKTLPIIEYFVKNSFFINFLYWSFPQKYNQDSVDYYIENYFIDEEILGFHVQNIVLFVTLCKEKEIPLIFVGFPYLNDLERTCPVISFIEEIFEELEVEFVNICELMEDIPLKKRIVNYNDAHPSVYVHKIVAEELYKRIRERNL